MKHRQVGSSFGRDQDHREMLLRNLLTALCSNGSIVTTETKAKALKSIFDKLVTRAKKNSLASRRYVEMTLMEKRASKNFYENLLPKLDSRNSGYTSLVRLEKRAGDKAQQIRISVMGE
jgi:large subunit ribosomal protein L17